MPGREQEVSRRPGGPLVIWALKVGDEDALPATVSKEGGGRIEATFVFTIRFGFRYGRSGGEGMDSWPPTDGGHPVQSYPRSVSSATCTRSVMSFTEVWARRTASAARSRIASIAPTSRFTGALTICVRRFSHCTA